VVSYQWYFGDSDSSTAQSPTHTYPQSGTYSVMLIVTDNNGCQDTIAQNVSPFAFSLADFSYLVDTCSMQVIFANNSVNAESVQWMFGDGTGSQSFTPVHVYAQDGTYAVQLITNPGTSCADTMNANLNYDLATVGNIWVPNAFTPNSDGKNDKFKVFAYYPCDVLTFYVFNRWGQKIYEYTGSEIVWDGLYNGKPVEAGIYIYILKGTYTDKIGSIAVIR
jgi:gliding motility-associated-like protein